MKSVYSIMLLAALASACGPNEFEFQQLSKETVVPPEICSSGCSTEEERTLLYEYTEVVPSEKKVDILFVDDNSGSMAEEQANMAMRFPNFISSLTGVNWQVGITTTDVTSNGAQGSLVPFRGTNLKTIDASTQNAESLFKETIQMGTSGSGNERGVYASVLAVEKNEGNWIRNDAHLAIVIISDENEASDGVNLEEKDMPATLISTVKSKLGQNKSFTAHSIITRPGDTVCFNGAGQSYGQIYADLSNATGGVIGDICAADYGAQLAKIAENIQNNFQSVTLKCFPINGIVDVSYTPALSSPITTVVDKDKLTFSKTLPAGTEIRLRYECKI